MTLQDKQTATYAVTLQANGILGMNLYAWHSLEVQQIHTHTETHTGFITAKHHPTCNKNEGPDQNKHVSLKMSQIRLRELKRCLTNI